jgi:hypothetical protein
MLFEHQIKVPVTAWRQVFVRVSVQGYNTSVDLEALFEALGSAGVCNDGGAGARGCRLTGSCGS